MTGNHKDLLASDPIEELTPGGHGLFRREVEGWVPVGLLQMDRIENRIGDVKQLLAARRNSQRHVAWCMAWCRNGLDTRQDFRFTLNQIELALDRREVLACDRKHELSEVFLHLKLCQVGL